MSGFRLSGHRLEPRAAAGEMVAVAGAIGGVQAQVMSAAEMALGVRVDGIRRADVSKALWEDRSLVKTWAARGTLHLLPSSELGLFMAACRSRSDSWWRAWEKYFGLSRSGVERLVESIGEALDGRALTRRELIDAVLARTRGGEALRQELQSGWGTFLKPAARSGVLCFGPSRGQEVTFVRPDQWLGRPLQVIGELEAGVELLKRYLRANAPATRADFGRWLGMTPVVTAAWKALRGELIPVGGGFALPDYQPQPPPTCLRLLPFFDAYLLSHADRTHLVSRELHSRVFRTAGWVAPVILAGGAIAGTWELRGPRLVTEEFRPLTIRERRGLTLEAERLGRFLGASVQLS